MADIFVSYGRPDKERVAPLVAALEAHGWSVWWDPAIIPGQEFDDLIAEEIDNASAVVVVWTPTSVASRWVRGEAREAADRGILVPVRFENARLPIDARAVHTTDLDGWNEDRRSAPFQEVLSALSLLLNDKPDTTLEVEHRTSICVLPFENMSGDPEQGYFSDGISEDIITDLSKVAALHVISRNSAFAFKGQHIDLPKVARQLNVSHVLEGSVRKSGNRVRITAQLIDGATNGHLWAERYDRELDDIFALQDEISEAIVKALKLTLFPEERKAIEDRGTDNVDAYDKYLRARGLAYQLGPTELERAMAVYRESLALDPDFARAWYGLYSALSISLFWIPEKAAEARREMEVASAKIVALAPDAWWTHLMRETQLRIRRQWVEAEAAGNAALAAAAASQIEALSAHGTFLAHVGRCNEAVEFFERARQADPLSLAVSGFLQAVLDLTGRSDEAQAEFERSKDLAGDRAAWEWLAVMRHWRRKPVDYAAVKAQFEVFLTHESLPFALNRLLRERLDDSEYARAAIHEAFEDPANQDPTRMSLINMWADHYGDKDLALAALRRAVVDMHGTSFMNLWLPIESGLRNDPRFKQLVRDVGIADYWRKSGHWADCARPVGDDDFEIIY